MPFRTFIHAGVDGTNEFFGFPLETQPQFPTDYRVWVDGDPLHEAQQFDTRTREVGFAVFKPGRFPYCVGAGEVKEMPWSPGDSIGTAFYTGPFMVTWKDIHGLVQSFSVK